MIHILRFLKKFWIFNFIRRIYIASKVYNYRYIQILKWGFKSREYTNFTYRITPENVNYLAATLATITGKDQNKIIQYIEEAENDTQLKKHILDTRNSSKLKSHADKNIFFGRRVGWYAFVRIMKPKVVVETGIDKGLGSVLLCSALLKNKAEGFEGKYYGTDINPAAGYLLDGIYKEVGEILYGDSIESLSKMTDNIDLFINDSDHSADYEYNEYKTIKECGLVTNKTVILGDNSHCTNKLCKFANEISHNFLFFKEVPLNHWYPGAGIGISFPKNLQEQLS